MRLISSNRILRRILFDTRRNAYFLFLCYTSVGFFCCGLSCFHRATLVTQVMHDVTSTAIVLRRHFGTTLKFGCLLDTQLALELLHGDLRSNVIVAVRNAVSVGPTVSRGAASRCRV